MNRAEILEKIIASHGKCEGATPSDCRVCPLSKLKSQTNGSPIGCIEALGIESLSEAEQDKKYLDAAIKALADIRIDEILKELDAE